MARANIPEHGVLSSGKVRNKSMTIKPIIPLNVMAVDPAKRVSSSTAVVSNLNDSSSTKKAPLVVKPVTYFPR